jgi:IS5 family transposase
MNRQISLSALTDELAQAKTRKKEFLTQMDVIIPWGEWLSLIRPHYYKGERGNQPYDLELMLRIHLLQNLYDLSDMGAMNEVIDSRAFSDFCGVESSNQVPDGDTIGRFRALLVQHGLQEKLFSQVVSLLEKRGLLLKKGSIVDSSIIAAPPSTKNREKKRDPDAHQTKKGNTWHFGYKAHIGVDKDSGLVHHLEVTAANVHDVTVLPKLLTGTETSIYGDSGYLGADKREDAVTHNNQGKKISYKINRRPSQSKNNSTRSKGQIKRREREKSSVRAKVEHVFGVVKGLFGYRKTRYKGRRKQSAKLHMMFALANLVLADKRFGLAV